MHKYTHIPRWNSPIGPVEREAQDMRGGHTQGTSRFQVLLRRVDGRMRNRLKFVRGVCTKLAQGPTRTDSRRPRRPLQLTTADDLASCDT